MKQGPLLIPFTQRARVARERLGSLKRLLALCRLCAYECEVRRHRGERGECELDAHLHLSSTSLHHGEEPVISGHRGSGTVFLTGCNLGCPFCQNFMFSHLQHGRNVSPRKLAAKMLLLQRGGAHNINLVTPSPQIPGILEALILAWEQGLSIPIVYNCGGYENLETLRLLKGLVDIYLPDLKYGSDEAGALSGPTDYFTRASAALREMRRQVGELELDANGVAVRGMIVRHLVLPANLSASDQVLTFLAQEIGLDTPISLMSQYFPTYPVSDHPDLSRPLRAAEYGRVVAQMHRLGFTHGWIQSFKAPHTVQRRDPRT